MSRLFRKAGVLLAVVFPLLAPRPAAASPIAFCFDGQVTWDSLYPFPVGTPFRGSYTFDDQNYTYSEESGVEREFDFSEPESGVSLTIVDPRI